MAEEKVKTEEDIIVDVSSADEAPPPGEEGSEEEGSEASDDSEEEGSEASDDSSYEEEDGESSSDDGVAIEELSDSDDDFQGDEGEAFGEYALVERLGKGGFSVVWKASRASTGDVVALKITKQNEDAEMVRELEALRRIGEHAKVLSPLDTFSETVGQDVHRAIAFRAFQGDLKTYIAECEGMGIAAAKALFRGLLGPCSTSTTRGSCTPT